jgi:tetratricopeptide (TPR) repeat protein
MDFGAARHQAIRLWEKGTRLQMQHELDAAIRLYQQSINLFPTAEAYTFLGWAMSWKGDIDGAIAQCKVAIEVDPDFGNPYNDIGAYLVEKGELAEAIEWFERAKLAKRYEPKHFPYLNLGRVYASQGKLSRAIGEFRQVLELMPGEPIATAALVKLRQFS